MKCLCTILLGALLLCAQTPFVFAEDGETSDDINGKDSRGAREIILHSMIGIGEITFANTLLMSYNYFFQKNVWALPDADSIHEHFTEPWIWEPTDGFKVNQMGHPIQGALAFNAGRANGFNFYESFLFSAFGSFTWESLGESNAASINDFITTSIGSLTVGEMTYRLYLEALAAGIPAPLAALFNPMAGVHQLVTRWKPPNPGRNLYQLEYHLGAGYAQTHYSISDGNKEIFACKRPFADIGFALVYGNPFEQESDIPFEHFEMAMSVGLDFSTYMGIRFISDAYLFSIAPVYTGKKRMSTGLSLQFDFAALGKDDIYDSTVDQFSNALDWTLKYQYLFSENTSLQTKLHTGFTFMGVSEYYSPETDKKDLKNYGPGLNSKWFVSLENKNLGKIGTGLFYYVMWAYPRTSALTEAVTHWFFSEVTVSCYISKHFSVGVTDLFALERGFYGGFPITRKYNNEVKLFFAWNI